MVRSWEELSLAKEHYTSFLIVRDPLDRLISCYRDKMVIILTQNQQIYFKKTTTNLLSALYLFFANLIQ